MTKNEVMSIKVYNPFTDEFSWCECYMEMSHEDNGKFIGGNLYNVITASQVGIIDYLSQSELDKIEQECLHDYEV